MRKTPSSKGCNEQTNFANRLDKEPCDWTSRPPCFHARWKRKCCADNGFLSQQRQSLNNYRVLPVFLQFASLPPIPGVFGHRLIASRTLLKTQAPPVGLASRLSSLFPTRPPPHTSPTRERG